MAGRASRISEAIHKEILNRITGAVQDTAEAAVEFAVEAAPVRKVIKGARYARQRPLSIGERAAQQVVVARLNRALPVKSPYRFGSSYSTTREVNAVPRTGGMPRSTPSNPRLRGRNARQPANAFRLGFQNLPGSTQRAVRATTGRELYGNIRRVDMTDQGAQLRVRSAFKGGGEEAAQTLLSARGRYELKTGRAVVKIGGRFYLGGRLRSEIRLGSPQPIVHGHTITQTVVSPTYYARYVEFGTRRSRAQPYMRPALAKVRERFASNIRREMRRKIRV